MTGKSKRHIDGSAVFCTLWNLCDFNIGLQPGFRYDPSLISVTLKDL